MHMLDLRSLRYFVVLARHLHYLRAASELGITQPTLTRAIQALERRLAVRLLDRDRGGVALTPQGQIMVERAALLLAQAEDLEYETRLAANGEGGRLRFGMTPMPAKALLERLLIEQLGAAPRVTNAVVVRDVDALWGMLTAGEIEFFVSSEQPPHDLSAARVEPLGTFPLTVVVRPGHPLLSATSSAARFPLLRSTWSGIPVPAEIEPHVLPAANVVEDYATLAGVTSGTDAVWMASAYAIARELADGSLVELTPPNRTVEVKLYRLARRSRSPLAGKMAQALAGHVAALGRSRMPTACPDPFRGG